MYCEKIEKNLIKDQMIKMILLIFVLLFMIGVNDGFSRDYYVGDEVVVKMNKIT
jgi:hypothetical protein